MGTKKFHRVTFIPMIIGEVRRYLRDNNTIRVSRSVRDLAYKALSARERLSHLNSNEPTAEEITAALNADATENGEDISYTAEDINNALEAIIEPISLYEPVFCDASGDSVFVMDQISDSSNTDENWLDDIAISEAMKKLSDRERSIINLRFYSGKTQMEIADEIGISHSEMLLCENTVKFVRSLSAYRGTYEIEYKIKCLYLPPTHKSTADNINIY